MITLEKKGAIAILTLNRPDAMNALGEPGDGEAVRDACAQINKDHTIRCAILTGAGKGFSAGGNVKAMRDRIGSFAGNPAEVRDNYTNGVHMIVKALYNLEIPLIAAVNGAAIGLGCDVACMADIRISSDNARYGVTFLKIGLIPGDGGAWLLPRVIGMSRACELLFTGNVIDARTALEWGLVSKVVPGDQLAIAKAGGIGPLVQLLDDGTEQAAVYAAEALDRLARNNADIQAQIAKKLVSL